MIGGLVHQQNVCLLQHSARESQLHSPASRQEGHWLTNHRLGEGHRLQHLANLFAGNVSSLNARIGVNVVDASQVRQLTKNVRLHKDGAHFIRRREAVHLIIGNGAHECGLPAVVATQQSILLATEQLEVSVVKKNLGPIGEGELGVAQFLSVLNLFLLLLWGHVDHALLENCLDGAVQLRLGPERQQVLGDVCVPLLGRKLGGIAHHRNDRRHEFQRLNKLSRLLPTHLLLHHAQNVSRVRLLRLVCGNLGFDTLQLVIRLLAHSTRFGVRYFLARFVQSWNQLGKEGRRLGHLLHQL
mmetsp:Transcript_17557/g.33557  ORF Transcript_17557/g.33557 Transcript_17557/m.33557 type:complete len:299 (+) Transcript_17557:1205-2101(+)